jgi:DNA-directed RNA polymerase subunit RPC12/RpoP
MEQQTGTGQESQQAAYCHWHPNVETGLSCSQCGRSICTRCLVQASVGIRCPECGKATRMPTFDVQPSYYARAAGAGVAVAVGGGVLWVIFNLIFGGFGILSSLPALAIGYGAGELISASANAKRSKGLAFIAAGSVIGAYIISLPSSPSSGQFFSLVTVAIAIFIAVQRVR